MYVSYISNTAWDDKPILHIILFVRKNLKTPKSNGVLFSQAILFTMKYYRFNRRGRYDMFAIHTYLKSQKKTEYMLNTDRSRKLNSFFLDNQVWGALHKAWKGYVIAKNKNEYEKMELYARRIQELQHDLGLEVSSFPNIGMSATSFFWQLAQEENDSQEQQVVAEEQNYLGDSQYEKERFTDRYTENFEDDENKADRFTDTYHENFTD
jgi:hypothetical protein